MKGRAVFSVARLLAVLTLVLLHAPARAETSRRPSARLTYERKKGAELCPDEASLRAHVEAQLGRDPFTPEAPWRIVASVARRGAGFVATMQAFKDDGEVWSADPITDPSCARLVNEILMMSIVIELTAPPELPRPDPPSAAPPPPRDKTPAVVGTPAPRASEVPRRLLVFGSGIEVGVGPRPSPVFALGLGVRWSIFSFTLEGRTDLPLTRVAEGGVPVQMHVVAGALLGCVYERVLHFYGCAQLALGVQRFGDARSPVAYESPAYAAAGGRLGLEIPFASRFAVNIAGDVLAALLPLTIRSNFSPAWQAGPVGGAAQGGLVAFF